MGRNRTPTALAEARGAFTRHPERKRARAGEPAYTGPLGEAPGYFNEPMRQCWVEIVAMAAPGVLTASDRGIVEAAARLMDELRQLTETIVTKDGMVIEVRKAVRSGDIAAWQRCLASMGLTPSDRAKISVPASPSPPSEWDALM